MSVAKVTSSRWVAVMLSGLLLGMASSAAVADSVTADGLPYKGGQLIGLDPVGNLLVQLSSGAQKGFAQKSVTMIQLDATPKMAQAEEAAAKAQSPGDWARAANLYSDAMRQVTKDVRVAIQSRAIRALDGAGKYDEATSCFLSVLAAVPSASVFDFKPVNVPSADSTMLPRAANQIVAKLKDKNLQAPELQKLLKGLLLDVYTKYNDKRAAALARELGAGTSDGTDTATTPPGSEQGTAAKPGTGTTGGDTASVAAAGTPVDFTSYDDLLAARKYDALIRQVDAQLGTADNPTAARLYKYQAQALQGQQKIDAAVVAYLRAAALGGGGIASDTLLQAAELQKTSDPEAAKRLYHEIAEKYPDSAAALIAKKNL